MKLKYVIIEDCKAIVFGEYFQHKEFQRFGEITSAGFCSIQERDTDFKKYPRLSCCKMIVVNCWGESISLGVKSKPDHDEQIIQRMYNN